MTRSWSVALQWMLATAAALALTMLVIETLFVAFLGFLLLPLFPLAGVPVGFAVGTLQWLVLRRLVPDTGYWILVTGSAFGGAWLVTLTLGFYVMGGGLFIVACAAGAAVIGFAQAALLRRWTRRARMWVPASIAAWTASAAILLFAPRPLPALGVPADRLVTWAAGYSTQSAFAATLLGGLMAGGITGVALPWVLDGRVAGQKMREPR